MVDYTSQDVSQLYGAPDKQFDIAIDCMGTRSESAHATLHGRSLQRPQLRLRPGRWPERGARPAFSATPLPPRPPRAHKHACPPPGKLLQQLLGVVKPSGHLSHIMNAGTDSDVLGAAGEAHEEGRGPGVGTVLVQPSGEQLQQVRVGVR